MVKQEKPTRKQYDFLKGSDDKQISTLSVVNQTFKQVMHLMIVMFLVKIITEHLVASQIHRITLRPFFVGRLRVTEVSLSPKCFMASPVAVRLFSKIRNPLAVLCTIFGFFTKQTGLGVSSHG